MQNRREARAVAPGQFVGGDDRPEHDVRVGKRDVEVGCRRDGVAGRGDFGPGVRVGDAGALLRAGRGGGGDGVVLALLLLPGLRGGDFGGGLFALPGLLRGL